MMSVQGRVAIFVRRWNSSGCGGFGRKVLLGHVDVGTANWNAGKVSALERARQAARKRPEWKLYIRSCDLVVAEHDGQRRRRWYVLHKTPAPGGVGLL